LAVVGAERYQIEDEMEDIQERYTALVMELERLRDTSPQEMLRKRRKERNEIRADVTRALKEAKELLGQALELETKSWQSEQGLRALWKKRKKNDLGEVLNLERVIFDRLTRIATIEEIDQFVVQLCGALPREWKRIQKLEELVRALTQFLRTQGTRAQQQLRIYALEKEIEQLEK
jgi:hypothetical protein